MATGFRNLTVCKKAFSLAMDIFKASKKFPKEEQYGLTSQIRANSSTIFTNTWLKIKFESRRDRL